jgi:hypothetical protein
MIIGGFYPLGKGFTGSNGTVWEGYLRILGKYVRGGQKTPQLSFVIIRCLRSCLHIQIIIAFCCTSGYSSLKGIHHMV